MPFTYCCNEHPAISLCPAQFTAKTRDELWEYIEIHSLFVHHEDPSEWTHVVKPIIESLIVQG